MGVVISLTRFKQTKDGTFGEWVMPGAPVLYTIEDDWLDNAKGKSCIPAGQYLLQRTIFIRHNIETFEVMNVPGRTRILVHPANTEEDVEGCIGLGLRHGPIAVAKDEDTGQLNVMKQGAVSSKQAFNTWMWAMHDYDTAVLNVKWEKGLPLPQEELK